MLKIMQRYFEGFDYLTTKISKMSILNSVPLLIFTLAIYPLSIFVLIVLYFITLLSIITFKCLNLIK